MSLSDVKEWILVVSGSFALVSVAVSSWLALKEYRLKLQAEARAANSEKAETDVRLVKAFTELMDIANGRGGYVVSEKVIEELFKRKFVDADFNDLESMKQKIGEFPVIYLPVGNASQDSAIAAIATLANRHEVLREPAKQALETAKSFKKDLAEKYLQKIVDT
ncbi:MAG: hypothetical protein ACT4OT_11845 [Acidobacteriota bacterium]